MKMSKDGSGIAVDKEVVKEMADAVLDTVFEEIWPLFTFCVNTYKLKLHKL